MKLFILILLFTINFGKEVEASQDFYNKNQSTSFHKVNFTSLKQWSGQDFVTFITHLKNTCQVFYRMPINTEIMPNLNTNITAQDIIDICDRLYLVEEYNVTESKKFIETNFTPYLVVNSKSKTKYGLFTGYYIPEIKVKQTKDEEFKYPIYRQPLDLAENYTIYTRKAINDGILEDKDLVLYYTDNFVELYFMHIQGSGTAIDVDTGEIVKLSFAKTNNLPYTSIGQVLVNEGHLSSNNKNAKAIKNFLQKDLALAKDITELNESYVFFETTDERDIKGGFGAELVRDVSLAVDPTSIPLGFPVFVETKTKPNNKKLKTFNNLMIAHDVGGAIKGSVRGDIFFGYGDFAEEKAAYQNFLGRYYLLIPKNIEAKLE